MRQIRPIIGLALGLLVLSSAESSVLAVSYSYPSYGVQTAATTYGYYAPVSTTAIDYVRSHGIMTGYAGDGFGENNFVNRAEFATVVMRVYSRSVPNIYTMQLPFWDTSNNAWYTKAIVYAFGNGLMTGYSDNSFHPDSPVAFDEAAKVLSMIYRLNVSTNNSGSQWYQNYVAALANQNAIPLSIGTLSQPLTRGELADIIYRLDSGDRSQPSQTYNNLVGGNYGNCSNGRDVMVTIDPSENNPSAGDSLNYDIKVQNCSGRDQQVDIVATLDTQTYFVSASNGGYSSSNRIVRWDNVYVNSGDSETVTLRTRVDGARNGDRINLNVTATDQDGNSDNESSTLTVSGSNNNCYYNQYGNYVCNNNNNCYYDSNNNYICNNNNNCYYDNYGHYICNNQNNCYYDSNNNYICNNNNNNCYYNSNGQYICNNNNNCYYNSNGQYICNNNNNCYYNSNGQYICNNNNNCYYNSNGQYVCGNNNNGNVNVTISPNSNNVEPGDTVTYDIRIRNNTSTDDHFTMHANFSSDLVYQSASDNVTTSDSQNLNWNDIFISRYQTELVTVKLRVRSNAYNGEQLALNLTASNSNGASDNESATVYVQNANNNNNCYYDNYGHYICNNNNNCYYNQYGNYVCNNTGNLSINIRNDGNSVQPGSIVHSYITIYNNDADQNVNLTAFLDGNMTYYSASMTPNSYSSQQIVWDQLFVRAHSTLYLTLDTRVNSFVQSGNQIRINVQAAGNTNTASDAEFMTVSY